MPILRQCPEHMLHPALVKIIYFEISYSYFSCLSQILSAQYTERVQSCFFPIYSINPWTLRTWMEFNYFTLLLLDNSCISISGFQYYNHWQIATVEDTSLWQNNSNWNWKYPVNNSSNDNMRPVRKVCGQHWNMISMIR